MSDQSPDGQYYDDTLNYKSISCEQIPEQFLDKVVAKEHFSQFGVIKGFILRPKRYECTVYYETEEAAENALMDGGVFNNYEFRVFYTPKETPKPKIIEENIDPDVQAELEAMGSVPIVRTFPQIREKIEKIERKPFPVEIADGKKIGPLPNTATKAEIKAILRKPALTTEDKYWVLDARDKLLRLSMAKSVDLTKAVATKGVCPDMCPEKERLMRQTKKQVASFEMDSRGYLNHNLAVKQYTRSSADQESALPHELRPEPVLRMTMNYLLHNIVDLCDVEDTNISDWFHFIWDRTRSIRKDITQQELCSQDSVLLVEQCARFHIHCSARLVAEDPSVFDQKINTENLTKCLQTLKYMYHDLALKGVTCPNEAEFRGYIVLLNIQNSNFLWEVKQLREEVQRSEPIRYAIDVFLAMESNNYVKFFQLVRKTNYMNACILLRYFNQVRAKALEVMTKAFGARLVVTFSLRHLTYILAFEDAEMTAQFAEYYGLPTSLDADSVTLDKGKFYHPDMPFLLDRAINVVEHKRTCSVGEAISNGPLESRETFENHQPHDSFDERGFLIDDSWMSLDVAPSPQEKPKVRKSKARDEADAAAAENIFKIPCGSPPISPKQSGSAPIFNRTAFSSFMPRIDSPKFSLAQKIHPEETTPPRFHIPEPKGVFATLKPINSSPDSPADSPRVQPAQPFTINFQSSGDGGFPRSSIFGGSSGIFSRAVAPPDGLFAEAARKVKLDKNEKEVEEEKKRQQREKEEQEMRKQEEEKKRLQEEEEKRRREEEEEEELRQERARLEEQVKHARKIESASKELTEKILEECMEEMCQEVAEDEIGAHRKFVENLQIALEEIIQETVDELTERMICEEYIVARRLLLLRFRNLSKCFRTWRKVVREKIQRRNIISNTPIWLPSQPLERQVEGFRHPHQEETIQLKSRYLRGVPDDFNLDRDPMDPVDFFGEIGKTFIEKARRMRGSRLLKSHYYWKLVVSIPGTGEETPGFPAYISKWLEEIFLRTTEQREKNVVFVEQQPVRNAQETLAVSVQAIHGRDMLKEDKTGFDWKKDIAHGIVFFMTVGNIENSLRRLEDLCDNLSTSEDIPVAIIVYNGHSMTPEEIERELNVTEQPHISAHIVKIYDENRLKNKTSLGTIFRDCLKFCARQYNFNVRLEMGRTSVFLDETLGSIFWKRLHLSAQVNPKLAAISHNINFVISLYNRAIARVVEQFALEDSLAKYPEFPEEFRKFVPQLNRENFITWEHFPDNWRERSFVNCMKDFLVQLKLPKFTFSGQVYHSRDIEKELRKYLETCLPAESIDRVTYGIMQPILATQLNETISWLRPVEIIAMEKLLVTFRGSQLPLNFVFNRDALDVYSTNPWWLKDDFLEGFSVVLDGDEPEAKKRREEMPVKLEDVLEQADKFIQKADEKLQKCQKIVKTSCEISRELDAKLNEEEENNRQMQRKWRLQLNRN